MPASGRRGTARVKHAGHIGAPACFALELACRDLCDAFECYGCYVVGSSQDRADWRDVDVRLIMDDAEFVKLFPVVSPLLLKNAAWEKDTRWLLLTVSISERLSRLTGLPVDFQFQPQTFANERHKGKRNAIGLRLMKPTPTPSRKR